MSHFFFVFFSLYCLYCWLPVWMSKWIIISPGIQNLIPLRRQNQISRRLWRARDRSLKERHALVISPSAKQKLDPLSECPHVPQLPVTFYLSSFISSPPVQLHSAEGRHERTLATTVGLKYPHDMRVSSNETPDRCLRKLSPIAVAHSWPHPER